MSLLSLYGRCAHVIDLVGDLCDCIKQLALKTTKHSVKRAAWWPAGRSHRVLDLVLASCLLVFEHCDHRGLDLVLRKLLSEAAALCLFAARFRVDPAVVSSAPISSSALHTRVPGRTSSC